MKKILGLDLGTNSIGWALIENDFDKKEGSILGIGTRIIPMNKEIVNEFHKGNSISKTAERTRYRANRRLRERFLLRRERLHRVLNVLGFLPKHYKNEIDFKKHFGKFKDDKEPKIAYDNNKFIFINSFNEMLDDFKIKQPELMNRYKKNGDIVKIPYDWTIYYLRKKALTEKIEKEELAWIILNFNKKRGYYQLRGEDDDIKNIKEYVKVLKVVKIEKGHKDKKNDKKTWYTLHLDNGWKYSATFTVEPQWLNISKEFLVTEELDENGNVKIINKKRNDDNIIERRKLTLLPSFEEIDKMSIENQHKIYKKIKVKTELEISKSNFTVGAYIYETLLINPNQKVKGKLIRTIDRGFYKDELIQILKKQIELQPELFTDEKFNYCISELYRKNDLHRFILSKKDFVHLFVNDIIFYQRPLKSQKTLIRKCPLEKRVININGENVIKYIKAIPKSNPYYQEFRIWHWIRNLRIYKLDDDTDVTQELLKNNNDYEKLFDFLDFKKSIKQSELIKFLLKNKGIKLKELQNETRKLRWNYVQDKSYPCNETKSLIKENLDKVKNLSTNFLNNDILYEIWHLIYSISDILEFEKALNKFAIKKQINNNTFVEVFKKISPFKKEYGSYSEKAIKKLLPLMRQGKYWKWDSIDIKTKDRITKLLNAEFDVNIRDKIREFIQKERFEVIEDFQGLPEWLAKYIVYNRHSETADLVKWNSSEDLQNYLNAFKQHSLRNPIVEQVVTETLRVVNDIWIHYGKGKKDYFDEIHIELGRELKNPAENRERITNKMIENENRNLRIKALLLELKNDTRIKNVIPNSFNQQEILKIYEEYAIGNEEKFDDNLNEFVKEPIPDDILKISKKAQLTKEELKKYKLWLEQKYRSPYTGKVIPLSKLFTTAYEIEHIIPQSLYYDDSLDNKVICETAVNKLKKNQLALEFIRKHNGEIIDTGFNSKVRIFNEDEYKDFVIKNYSHLSIKRKNLLAIELPLKVIERQLNDTRFISRFISSVLSNIVREERDDNGFISKNIIVCNGKITAALRQDWNLNELWNDLILHRFERMNSLTSSKMFTLYDDKIKKYLPIAPFELQKGFNKKRLDHRNHALDAIIIACTNRNHVSYLNNEHALLKGKRKNEKQKFRFDLRSKLCEKNYNNNTKHYNWVFKKPWNNFTYDVKCKIESIIVCFKQNLRVINKSNTYYKKIKEKNEHLYEDISKQNNINWAIRKPLHKEMFSGLVKLKYLKVPSGKVVTAIRKSLDDTFSQDKIKTITDSGIQKILFNYLLYMGRNPKIAFSPEGIEELNNNIEKFNDEKPHKPIFKVRIFEIGNKFQLGYRGNKKYKYVEAQKGTNLFFAVYINEEGKRSFETIPLITVIERQKQGLYSVPEFNDKGDKLLFYLSPNDLVYVPKLEELSNNLNIDVTNINSEIINRIYRFTDSSETTANFIPANVSDLIFNMKKEEQKSKGIDYTIQNEFGLGSPQSKNQKSLDGLMIKEVCKKIIINRLGHIMEIIN